MQNKCLKHVDFSEPAVQRSNRKSANALKRNNLRLEKFKARKSNKRKTERVSSPSPGLEDHKYHKYHKYHEYTYLILVTNAANGVCGKFFK